MISLDLKDARHVASRQALIQPKFVKLVHFGENRRATCPGSSSKICKNLEFVETRPKSPGRRRGAGRLLTRLRVELDELLVEDLPGTVTSAPLQTQSLQIAESFYKNAVNVLGFNAK